MAPMAHGPQTSIRDEDDMIAMLARIFFGFVLACLVAGLVQVLFVTTPAELMSETAETLGPRLLQTGTWALLAATHIAIFSAAFVLIAAGVGEMLGVRSLFYYLLAGAGIALLGFYAQLSSESLGQATVRNAYALSAFVSAGLAGGLIYWWTAGRAAGRRRRNEAAPETGAASTGGRPRLIVEDATVTVTKAASASGSLSQRIAEIEAQPEAGEPAVTKITGSETNNDSTRVRIERATTAPSGKPRTVN